MSYFASTNLGGEGVGWSFGSTAGPSSRTSTFSEEDVAAFNPPLRLQELRRAIHASKSLRARPDALQAS
eukprot:7411769-Pyramimonas_sp.AAC.1